MQNATRKIRILLVDDDEMMRIYFRDIFWIHGRSNDYEILMASSIEEAENIIKDKNTCPNTIFLDLVLSSRKSGVSSFNMSQCIGFVKKIKSNKELSNIKIILYSGHSERSIQEELKKVGVDGFLVKGESMPKEIIAFADELHGTR